jgi:hypothetical protein
MWQAEYTTQYRNDGSRSLPSAKIIHSDARCRIVVAIEPLSPRRDKSAIRAIILYEGHQAGVSGFWSNHRADTSRAHLVFCDFAPQYYFASDPCCVCADVLDHWTWLFEGRPQFEPATDEDPAGWRGSVAAERRDHFKSIGANPVAVRVVATAPIRSSANSGCAHRCRTDAVATIAVAAITAPIACAAHCDSAAAPWSANRDRTTTIAAAPPVSATSAAPSLGIIGDQACDE